MDTLCTVRLTMVACIVSMLTVMAGTPQNPWLWSCLRDTMGLPWSETQLGQEMFVVFMCMDFVVLMLLLPLSVAGPKGATTEKRRLSRKTRTVLWLLRTLWSLKGSKIRGLKQRPAAPKPVDTCVEALKKATFERQWSDASTSPGSSRDSTPCSSPDLDSAESPESVPDFPQIPQSVSIETH